MGFKISPSSLGLMKRCPRCFWWYLKRDIKRPEDITSRLANRIDTKLKEDFDLFRQKQELPPVLNEIKDMQIGLYKNQEEIRRMRYGLEYFDRNKGILLNGKMDDVLQRGNKLVVFDFKTTSKNEENCVEEEFNKAIEEYNYNVQLGFYSYLLRKKGYLTEDFGFLLFYFIS